MIPKFLASSQSHCGKWVGCSTLQEGGREKKIKIRKFTVGVVLRSFFDFPLCFQNQIVEHFLPLKFM